MSRQQIDFPVQQHQIGKPANPPAGAMKLYPKSDGKFYKLDSAGVEEQVGSTYVHPDPFTIGTLTVSTQLNIGSDTYLKRTGTTALQIGANVAVTGSQSIAGNQTIAGNLTVTGSASTGYLTVNGHVVTNDGANGLMRAGAGDLYLRSSSASNATRFDTQAATYITGRLVAGNYDPGWQVCLQANPITDGRFYQRNNASLYCIDIGDCSMAASGSTIVQRRAEGYIYANYFNTTADVAAGAPAYVAGQNGDGFIRWYPKSVVAATSTIGSAAWQSITTGNGWSNDRIGMYAHRTGHAHVSCWVGTGTNGEGAYCALRLLRNGGVLVEGTGGNGSGGRTTNVHWNGATNVNDYFTVQAYIDNNKSHYNGACEFWITVGTN